MSHPYLHTEKKKLLFINKVAEGAGIPDDPKSDKTQSVIENKLRGRTSFCHQKTTLDYEYFVQFLLAR